MFGLNEQDITLKRTNQSKKRDIKPFLTSPTVGNSDRYPVGGKTNEILFITKILANLEEKNAYFKQIRERGLVCLVQTWFGRPDLVGVMKMSRVSGLP